MAAGRGCGTRRMDGSGRDRGREMVDEVPKAAEVLECDESRGS